MSQVVESISEEHARIHEGQMFSYSDISTVAQGASLSHAILTGAKQIHLAYQVFSDQATTFSIIEGCTVTGGTPVTKIYNRKRTSPLKQTLAMTDGVTPSNGTTIFTVRAGTASAPSAPVLIDGPREKIEFILAPNTMYVLQVTNNSGAASASVSQQIDWYEQD